MLFINDLVAILFKRRNFYIYVFCIFLLTVLPLNGSNVVMSNTYIIRIHLDYLLHVILFLPWVLFFTSKCNYLARWVLFGLAFALISEGIQFFLPYRAFNINDLISNIIGILLGFTIFTILKRFLIKT